MLFLFYTFFNKFFKKKEKPEETIEEKEPEKIEVEEVPKEDVQKEEIKTEEVQKEEPEVEEEKKPEPKEEPKVEPVKEEPKVEEVPEPEQEEKVEEQIEETKEEPIEEEKPKIEEEPTQESPTETPKESKKEELTLTPIPISREQALALLKEHNKDMSDFNHYLESEAIMKALAKKIGEDEHVWAMLGLLHDVDWGLTKENTQDHLTKAPEILKNTGFTEDFIKVVLSHGYGFDCAGLKDKKRTEKVEHALACSETVTGLIHAYALMRGSIEGMKAKGLKKKFKDKRFAANVDRDIIKECENLGLELSEFFQLAIDAVKDIADEVGLTDYTKPEETEKKPNFHIL
jgi:hypothetical protein